MLRARPQVMGRQGMRCWVRQGQGRYLEAVGFDRSNRWRDQLAVATGPVSMVYTPVLRQTEGVETIQLQIKDVRDGAG